MAPATWPAHWPLTVTLAAFPLWWVLGVSDIMPVIMAVPMALQLAKRGRVRTPVGFPAWLLFLVVLVASGLMLWLDAPGAVPGGAGTRPLVFGYRLSWYLACAVVLLWMGNLDEDEVPSRRVVRLLGWMFVLTALGGLLGVLAPRFEFSSAAEILLPGVLSENYFVKTLIHPAAASVQNILGSEYPRPIAPFAFANSWGANLSMFLPFFVVGWWSRNAGWRRSLAWVVSLMALVPIVFSLNRGLWISLVLGAVAVIVHLALNGRPGLLAVAAAVLAVGALVFMASPLATMTAERLENPHSNSRRGQLLSLTVESVALGSPVIGFGSTRDVQGSFASIAGGGTPDCPGCEVPSLGTQGQIWLVVFSQGFLGLAAFVGFFARQVGVHWRSRTTLEFVGIVCLLFFFVQLFIYDTLGMPMYTLMLAIGLMWREQSNDPLRLARESTLGSIAATVRRNRVLVASLTLLGTLGGLLIATASDAEYRASVLIMLEDAPVHVDLGVDDGREPSSITVDTEASMVFSQRAMRLATRQLDLPEDLELRDTIEVTAPPNTKVLRIAVTTDDAALSAEVAESVASAYIAVRSDYLELRRDQVVADLNAQLDTGLPAAALAPDPSGALDAELLTEEDVRRTVENLLSMPEEAGQKIRPAETLRLGTHLELPVVSGALLGMIAALLAVWTRRRLRQL